MDWEMMEMATNEKKDCRVSVSLPENKVKGENTA